MFVTIFLISFVGFSVSLLFSLDSLPEDHEKLAQHIGLLKRNCFASVFEKYFDICTKGEGSHKRAVIHYRDNETM